MKGFTSEFAKITSIILIIASVLLLGIGLLLLFHAELIFKIVYYIISSFIILAAVVSFVWGMILAIQYICSAPKKKSTTK